MSSTPIEPRPLTDLESDAVTKLLSAGGVGAAELLMQIPCTQVVATWGIGSPSVDLMVQWGVATAAGPIDGVFANGAVTDLNGSSVGELILWVENGWLSGVEYAWYTDERPRTLPDPEQIVVL
ncbi:hypothetical protein BOX37_08275 [Nocardia mangyaensis]|uniref:Uncharacterized protein n=1 Tax=Nocardia mangyaensis TaxID=2213200 RepID=A0A1J0VPN2_9NOCA|nr:hypothetical protein [Nocardia mangyaensis]APE33969.1 hypothetical protein BOX37_08275 [Nocardia mangyaensis]